MKRLIALLAGLTVFSSFMTMSFAAEVGVSDSAETDISVTVNEQGETDTDTTTEESRTVTTTTLAPVEDERFTQPTYTSTAPSQTEPTRTTITPIISLPGGGTVTTTLAPNEDEKFTQTAPLQSDTRTTATTTTGTRPVDEMATVPYLIGDYNGDKWVNMADYTALEEIISEFDGVYPQSSLLNSALIDINRDNVFDDFDLAFLKDIISGEEPMSVLEWNPRTLNIVEYNPLSAYDTHVIGDTGSNGIVDVHDYEFLTQYVNGEIQMDEFWKYMKIKYDVNADNTIDGDDIKALGRLVRGWFWTPEANAFAWSEERQEVFAYFRA
jgi:hypothetical protein